MLKKCLNLSFTTLLLTFAVSCNSNKPIEPTTPTEIELIPGFEKGFTLTGYDSRYPENHDIGRLEYGEQADVTHWRIGQWGATKNLIDSVHTIENNVHYYKDGSKTLAINDNTGGFTLGVDGSKDYTKDRADGEEWIHFILEVMPFPNKVQIKDLDYIDYYLEFTLTKAINNNIAYNPNLHTALFIWYITLNNLNPKSPGYGDYMWFGVPVYDYRYDYSPFFAQQDSGKEDRTDKFIVNLAGETVLHDTVTLDIPQILSVDVYPHLKNAVSLAKERGFLTQTTLEDLSIGSMYIGWELPGNFDVSMDVDVISIKVGKK